MTLTRSVKSRPAPPLSVGVIRTVQEFERATRLPRAPDLFELRLDALGVIADKIESVIVRLRAPLIVTARHPLEGGRNDLAVHQRRDLLLRFLSYATFIDIELRAARQLRVVLAAAEEQNVKRVISVHDVRATPSVLRMHRMLDDAETAGADIFKIATRTDSAEELDRLISFFDSAKTRIPISAMGIGKLGRQSREIFAARGSALNYGHLSSAAVDGQLSLAEVRKLLRHPPTALSERGSAKRRS